jgi:hypothetical protein
MEGVNLHQKALGEPRGEEVLSIIGPEPAYSIPHTTDASGLQGIRRIPKGSYRFETNRWTDEETSFRREGG